MVINRYLESRVGDHWREPLALVRRIVDHGPFPLSTTGSGLALWIFDEWGFPVPVHVLVPIVGLLCLGIRDHLRFIVQPTYS